MVYSLLTNTLKKEFFIISFEKYRHTSSDRYVERYIAKHRLLTPELIVLNDQPHGFKKTREQIKSLEKFPVYCEIDYLEGEEDDSICVVESIDLFSEVTIQVQSKLQSIQDLCHLFEDFIDVDRIKRIGKDHQSSFAIHSKLGDIFLDRFLEKEIEEGKSSELDIQQFINTHLRMFNNFIQICNELFFKNKTIESISPSLLP
ncbi:hypothetical protein DID77_01465 [Candidatus Marinamargulisbacteria bacterium SCGC AG-439-L15]|nr:hypothetical protein DID77_01465 [Candidatus Marinamargulisbacteria bacterium SCGC AG-439-L15]